MYTVENYHWGLVGYYFGCLLIMLYLWRFRALIPGRHFRSLLLLLIASVILVPVTAYTDNSYLAPAWFVSLFEGFTEATEEGYLRAALPIAIVYAGSVIVYFIWAMLGFRRNKPVTESSDTEELAEE